MPHCGGCCPARPWSGSLTLLVILALVVLALFTVVFPWATQFVPGQEVSVD